MHFFFWVIINFPSYFITVLYSSWTSLCFFGGVDAQGRGFHTQEPRVTACGALQFSVSTQSNLVVFSFWGSHFTGTCVAISIWVYITSVSTTWGVGSIWKGVFLAKLFFLFFFFFWECELRFYAHRGCWKNLLFVPFCPFGREMQKKVASFLFPWYSECFWCILQGLCCFNWFLCSILAIGHIKFVSAGFWA